MKKLALLVVLVMAFALMGGVALAAETPHGPFDANSAVCAACHRAHTSSAEYLLATPRVTGLCIGCHDGTGADTDVVNGAFVTDGSELPTSGGYDHGTWGTAAKALMGGGFTRVTYGGANTNTTSKHMDPTGGFATTIFQYQWGKKATTQVGPSGGYVKTFLDCVDCHMPHRSTNYRMLRVLPTGYTGTNLAVPSQGIISDNTETGSVALENAAYAGGAVGRRYTEDSGMFNTVMGTSTSGYASISKWCGKGCHDFYYDAAVRIGNGHTSGASPAMTTRTTVTYTAATTSITVANGSLIVAPTHIYINGDEYDATAVVGNVVTINPPLDMTGGSVFAGTPVSISGTGMQVYYDLDPADANGTAADPTFTHAIDVDLEYTPRNGSSGVQPLANNLKVGGYGYALPVADQNGNHLYDSTDVMTCVTCHRAHGTDVTMAGEASIPAAQRMLSGVQAPSGNAAATQGSMLLRLENRAVCQQCHMMPTGF